ncbi:hypothetical protein TSPI_08862 [Trichinella spiralis]|uniref:Uncharacterized protein n=1 Tax=Trichinella spiralis TaxID=6334 RepID=A0ABR3KFM7_TRISP
MVCSNSYLSHMKWIKLELHFKSHHCDADGITKFENQSKITTTNRIEKVPNRKTIAESLNQDETLPNPTSTEKT